MNNKKYISIVIVVLLIALILSGCAKKGVPFKREDMESMRFKLSYASGTVKEEGDITDAQTLDAIYSVLETIKFDKKLPKKDIWTGRAKTYDPPAYYHTLEVKLKDGNNYSLYIGSDRKCYKPGEYGIYSDCGTQLLIVMEKYFAQERD
jgi:hypothetical protein